MVCRYTCEMHEILYTINIIPLSKYKKRCVNCLKKHVDGYKRLSQVTTPEYNYLYPMICDNCSRILKQCKWCRLVNTRIISDNYLQCHRV